MIKLKHNSNDAIESYVTDCDPVPLISEINRNGKLIITEFDFNVSVNYTTDLTIGDDIDVFINTSTSFPFFVGSISEVNFNYRDQINVVTVRSCLYKLQDIVLNYDNLHTNLSGLTGDPDKYIASDNFGLPNAQVLWIIEMMFYTAEFYNVNFAPSMAQKVIQRLEYLSNFYTMSVGHLKFDENTLYALNQPYAINHTAIEGDAELSVNQITFFDFISNFCSHVGAKIGLRTSAIPKALSIRLIGTITIPAGVPALDDEIYQRRERYIQGKPGGYGHTLQFAFDRDKYNDSTYNALVGDDFISGNGKNSIRTIPNWIYMYQKTAGMGGSGGDVLGHAYPSLCWNADKFLGGKDIDNDATNYNHISAAISDYDITELSQTFNGDFSLYSNSKSARANPKEVLAENVFEVKQ